MEKFVSGLLLFSVYVGIIAPFGGSVSGQVVSRTMASKSQELPSGFTFRLSEGYPGGDKRERQAPAAADALAPAETEKLLDRIPAVKVDNTDQIDFAKRAGTLPPPKSGRQISVAFPSEEGRGTPKINPGAVLEVVRHSPDGEISLAPDLSVTFSQPMVVMASQEEAAKYAPVELSPQLEGRWRWLGTKTLMFDTTKRFPMATGFTARVPAGTRAATGQTLAKDVVWTFATPPPKVEQTFPQNQVVGRDALIFVSFDQMINPDAVLKAISVSSSGKPVRTRLATPAEIENDVQISSYVKRTEPGRWLVLRAIDQNGRAENAFHAASPIVVTINKGTPSAEGPLRTETSQAFQFTTFGAQRFVRSMCGWAQNPECSPFETWLLEFTNPVDASAFSRELIKIEPAVEGLKVYPSGNYVYIEGIKKGRTTYKITVDAGLKDSFGQTLGQPITATIKVGSVRTSIYAEGGFMSVLDPAARPTFSIYSTNQNAVKVKMYAVEPGDWPGYQNYVRHLGYADGKRPEMPGKLVFDKIVNVKNKPDEMVETRIDLNPALADGFGSVIVDIEPTVRRDQYDRDRILSWLQATQIGLDAFVDSSELVGFATDLRSGEPLSGVELSILPNGAALSSSNEPTGTGVVAGAVRWIAGLISGTGSLTSSFSPDGVAADTVTFHQERSGRTGPSGVTRLRLPEVSSSTAQNILVARRGKDVAFLPENAEYYWQESGNWFKKSQADSLRWFVFDDRRMYRPNEEVSVKGYIRKLSGGKLGDIEGLGDAASAVAYSVKDPRNNEIASGSAAVNAFGAFDLQLKLPDNANLGSARLELTATSSISGNNYVHNFQIQEFRRPEFEVSTKVETAAPFFIGDSADVSVEAKYYSGGGLAAADANWTVTATPTNYTPPNRGDYVFGVWVPWWGVYDGGYGRGYYGGESQSFKGVTDASGKHLLKIDFQSVSPARPYNLTAAASVQDVNRQTWSSSTSLLVHPASLYVGLKTPRTFVQKGEKIYVDSIVSDIDGKLIAGRNVEIKALLKDWTFDKGSWKEEVVDEQLCSVMSTEAAQSCSFAARQGGRYVITATVMDDRERFNQSELTVWVPGGKTPPKRSVEQEQAQVIPSKQSFDAGETAELLVISPFSPAEGVLTLRRDGIVKTQRFSMKEASTTLKIPIEASYLPNIHTQVDLVGSSPRTDDKGEIDANLASRPAFATGSVDLSVSTESRRLTVYAEPRDKTLVPGGQTKVDIEVKDSSGSAVRDTEVAVIVVDESVLALSRYRIDDPVGIFYSRRGTGTQDYHSRAEVLLGNPADAHTPPPPPPSASVGISADSDGVSFRSELKAAPSPKARNLSGFTIDGASGAENEFRVDGQEAGDNPIRQRANFAALAVFAPSVRTNASGKATVDIKLPDNLTRYRITAVAVNSGRQFGITESAITAKQPLMVRPSAPRFMNFGDKIELPVVVQNQTDQDMRVDVAVRATNANLSEPGTAVDGSNSAGKRVVVRANDRAEIRFPASTLKAGTARFQIAGSSGKYSDSAEISLPVWTPATTEAFATYGTTDENGAIIQPVQTLGDVFPQFGGLEITTSSTQLQELTDAFIYLTNYPYACSEQIASRAISIAAMRDVLDAFKAKDMPTKQQLEAYLVRDMQILQSRQREDGSFGLWKRERERYEYPFLTVHVAHALALAKSKGYKVPQGMIDKAKPFLRDVEKHFDGEWYKNSPQVRWTISAYALYVRDLLGDKDTAKAKRLLAEATIEKMPFEGIGWVLSIISNDAGSATEREAIIRFLMNRTTETAGAANFVTDYGDGAWLIMYSNRRADGVLLEALIKSDPKNDLIPKLVRGLLDHRVKGAWSNTQENVFILLALDKYFNAFEKVTPDFVARLWLGATYAGDESFKGRSIDSKVLNIPMTYLTQHAGVSNLLIDRQGAGRLYYRIGMKYAPKNLKLDPADYGFTVLRQYEAIDNGEDVKQNADGSWTIRSGARVRVRLTMVAQARRYHVALVDQLPAGLEILNPELAVTESIPGEKYGKTPVVEFRSQSLGRGKLYWRQNWFEHQNFRDERAEAFTSLLWEGVYNYSYVARASTPGEFVVPPAKAEEMYHPETFGRTGTDFVMIQ